MLDGLRDRRARKGHAYSRVSWEGFRLLPSSTQIGLVLASLFVFLVLLALIAPSTYKAPVKVAEKDVTELLEGDSTTVEIKKEDKTVKPSSDEKHAKLREQVKQLYEETQNLKKQLEARKSGSSSAVAVSTPNPLGTFDWESLRMEPNSTERRFWVKTATNEEGHHFYRRILISNGWVETSNPNHEHCYFLFYGRFVPNLDQEFDMFQEGKHMINHIPGEFAVLNKEPFLHYIRDWSRDNKCDYTAMHPESYLLHVEKDCEDAFRIGNPDNALVRTGETQAERDDSYWFWKPPFNSFGRGIKVSQLKVLREQFGFGKALEAEPDPEAAVQERCRWLAQNLTEGKNKLLIQRAVDKPFLIKKSKFDFRAYILIANAKPYNVYFKFGHARRCLYDFDITSKIKKAHVCNDYSDDLETPGFPLHEHIWTYETFKEHLMSLGYSSEQVEKGFNDNMKRLFLGVFHTFKDAIPRKNGYWLLLGLDVAIDQNWEVKVLEINTNPSIHYATRVWGPGMAERNWKQMNEILHLVYDSHLKTKKYKGKAWKKKDLIMNTKYGFELLYSDAVSPPYQYVDEPCFKQEPLAKHP